VSEHKRPTLREVSIAAGLSVTQTSRALNGHADVAKATRDRALAAAKSLGYAPNLQARRLKMPDVRAHVIGIVLSPTIRFSDPFLGELLTVMVAESSQAGYELQLSIPPPDENPLASYERAIRQRRVDGFVLLRIMVDDERIGFLQQEQFPFVTYGRLPGGTGFSSVDEIDESLKPAVDLLVDLGHTRIGCLAEPLRQAKATARLNSFLSAMKERGLTVEDRHIVDAGFREQSGYAATKTLLSATQRPTALVALNDLVAIGALHAAADLGLRVPEDLSIVGFDDIEAARMVTPSLTTLRQPTTEIGRLLIQELVRAVERQALMESPTNENDTIVRLVEPRLVVRQSTGPA
jgi:LacI family transcriptional regulator